MKFKLFNFGKKTAPESNRRAPYQPDEPEPEAFRRMEFNLEPKGNFNLETIYANALSGTPVEGNKVLAYGVAKYAEVIAENFSSEEIDYLVWPKDLDPTADKKALPIHFLFKRDGKPVLALVIITVNGANVPRVVSTYLWCKLNGIKYINMYANGTYADWIWGESTGRFDTKEELEQFCKNWVRNKIQQALE